MFICKGKGPPIDHCDCAFCKEWRKRKIEDKQQRGRERNKNDTINLEDLLIRKRFTDESY